MYAMSALPPDLPVIQSRLVLVGIAALVALAFQAVRSWVVRLTQGEDDPRYHPVKVASDFSARAGGSANAAELAAATSAMLAELLQVRRSAWLMIDSRETLNFVIVPGAGRFPTTPGEFSHTSPFLQLLNQTRAPLLHSKLQNETRTKALPSAEQNWLAALEAAVYVPVFNAGALSSVLVVGARDRQATFHVRELQVLTILASQAGALLKTIHVIADLQQLNASMAVLNQSLQETNATMTSMNSARSDFLAIASHELRTPLAQMLGFADLLNSMAQDNTFDPALVKDITGNIVRACDRLNAVVGQILDMAQIDVDAMDFNFADTTLEEVVRLTVEPYTTALRERRLNLSVKGLRGLPILRADKARLVQAFSQLLSNAIKFTPNSGALEIAARLVPPDKDLPPQVEVVFADGGIGLDPKHHTLIFEKFYRVGSAAQHSTSNTNFMGAGPGLGLPIAKGVIEGHGGRIWVESARSDAKQLPGSRFHVLLPLTPPAFDPRALTASVSAPAKKKEVTIVPSKKPFIGID